jgi:hypothetical protein
MRKLASLFMVVAVAVAVLGTGVAVAAADGTSRPIKSRGSGSGLTTLVGGVPATYVIDGTLHGSHVGRSTFHVDGICTNPTCTTSTFTTTIVAANGDTLTSSSTSTGTATTFTNLDTNTGGTGRFAEARGHTITTGTSVTDPSNPLAFTITFRSRGTIRYDADPDQKRE